MGQGGLGVGGLRGGCGESFFSSFSFLCGVMARAFPGFVRAGKPPFYCAILETFTSLWTRRLNLTTLIYIPYILRQSQKIGRQVLEQLEETATTLFCSSTCFSRTLSDLLSRFTKRAFFASAPLSPTSACLLPLLSSCTCLA